MSNKYFIWKILTFLLLVVLLGCKSNRNSILPPEGTVPKRSALPSDPYGGYITILTDEQISISGELIGTRNDTIFVFANSLNFIKKENVLQARVIVYTPNNYTAGLIMGIPSILLLGLAPTYGGGPIIVGLLFTIFDVLGVSGAHDTEQKKVNYFDLLEGWNLVMQYSRFPSGIPSFINLEDIQAKPRPVANNKK